MSPNPVTLATLCGMAKEGRKFSALTCYDATTARWLAGAGVEVLLVGDTAAQMILGHDLTLPASMDFMVELTAAVSRGAPDCFVMADMPFLSYQADDAEGVHNAGRFLVEGGADAVKLEVDADDAGLIRKMARAGIPVVAHLGSRPQQARRQGGYRAAGRTAKDAKQLVSAAQAMAAAGAVMILLEATTAEVSRAVTQRTDVPVIGCGAGPDCHGHVVVLHDLLGLSAWQPPFAPPMAAVGEAIQKAARQWVKLVQSGDYLRDKHPYSMEEGERRSFEKE